VLSSVGVSPQCTPGHPEISAHSRQVPEVDYESGRFLFALFAHEHLFTFALSLSGSSTSLQRPIGRGI